MNYLKNVTTLSTDVEKCTGCGSCVDICPHGVLSVENDKVKITDRDSCMECGGCAKNCPAAAISVRSGVGCAGAVIYGFFGRKSPCSCGGAKTEKSRRPAAPAVGSS